MFVAVAILAGLKIFTIFHAVISLVKFPIEGNESSVRLSVELQWGFLLKCSLFKNKSKIGEKPQTLHQIAKL